MKLNKMYRLIALSCVFCTVAPLFSAAGEDVEKKYNWLILAGGGPGAEQHFNTVFQGTPISWYCFDVALYKRGTPCFIIGDYNKLEDLEKIPDNYFNVILFDQAAVAWLKWNEGHLKIISRKLTDPGILFIPGDIQGFGRANEKLAEVPETAPEYIQFLQERLKGFEPNSLLLGANFYPKSPSDYHYGEYQKTKHFTDLFNRVKKYNVEKLENVFLKADWYDPKRIGNSDPEYPVVGDNKFRNPPKNYYIALKSSSSASLGDIFKDLITEQLKK